MVHLVSFPGHFIDNTVGDVDIILEHSSRA